MSINTIKPEYTFIWKESSTDADCHRLYVGNILFGQVYNSIFTAKGDVNKYTVNPRLPQMVKPPINYATVEEAKLRMEAVARSWLKMLSKSS